MKSAAWARTFMLAHAGLLVVAGLIFWLFPPELSWFAETSGPVGYEPYALVRLFGAILIGFGLLVFGTSVAGSGWVQPGIPGALLGSSLLGLGTALFEQLTVWKSWQGWLLAGGCALLSTGYAAILLAPFWKSENRLGQAQIRQWALSPVVGISLQLLVGLILSGSTALGVFSVLQSRMTFAAAFTLGILSGVILGSAWCFLLLRRIHQLDQALQRLAMNQPLEKPLSESWPLGRIDASTNSLHREAANSLQMRETLTHQVGEAAAQQERNRLARELHDSIKQQLFSINASAAAVQARWDEDPESARAFLDDVRQSAREAMTEMNALLQQLRPAPLENVGLLEALREQCEALGYRTGAAVTHHFTEMPPAEAFPIGAQEALFRIAQEALSNIARHARARHVELDLAWNEGERLAILTVCDDGKGFAAGQESTGMGIANMSERARLLGGEMVLESAPGKGTRLMVKLPVALPDALSSSIEILPAETAALNRTLITAALTFVLAAVAAGLTGLLWFDLNAETAWRLWAFVAVTGGISGYNLWRSWQRLAKWRRQAGSEHPTVVQSLRQAMTLLYYAGAAAFLWLPWVNSGSSALRWVWLALGFAGIFAAIYGLWQQHRLTLTWHKQLDAAGRAADVNLMWQRHQPVVLLGLFFLMIVTLFVSFSPISLGIILTEGVYLGYLVWLRRKTQQKAG